MDHLRPRLREPGPARLRRPHQRRHRPDRRQGPLEQRLPAHRSTRACSAAPSGEPILYVSNPKGMDRDDAPPQPRRAARRSTSSSSQQFGDPGDADAHQPVRAGLPHADGRARGDGHRARSRSSVRELYGAEPGEASFANNCLLARRLVERGVRYVQLFDWGWDIHGTGAGDDIVTAPAEEVQGDRPADRGPAQGPQAARACSTRRSSSGAASSAARR